jgi:hypothetical protein
VIIHADSFLDEQPMALIDDMWHPARPIHSFGFIYRFKCAWLVLTGKADALVWYKQ